MFRSILLGALILLPLGAMTQEERRQYRDKLVQTLPPAPEFQKWLDKTGEIAPDFDAFPRVNGLPDPLKFLDGRVVKTQKDWAARKAEIRQLFEKYDLGTFPPKPKIDRVVPIDENVGQG